MQIRITNEYRFQVFKLVMINRTMIIETDRILEGSSVSRMWAKNINKAKLIKKLYVPGGGGISPPGHQWLGMVKVAEYN